MEYTKEREKDRRRMKRGVITAAAAESERSY
jgi:hypothetical protein